MKHILCFGDSNTYGLIPESGGRYPWGIRWTSLLNNKLGIEKYQVIEEGLCGRTTIFDDPLRDNRNGLKLISAVLETNGPVDVVIVMLGTNDCKTVYGATAEVIGRGITRIIEQIHSYSKDSKILLISPIHLGENVWENEYDPEFSPDSVKVSKGLADVYKRVSEKENTFFLDAAVFAEPSSADREHLNEEGHGLLAEAVYRKVREII
ncbi:MAG: SGNH/GDSL hydrolase family protein [Lachnospiraceae bacterium]|nr:SGNH/GDSL hydrolase family protein [Lachnospiraceae bacterium]MDE6252145.1 SGNH/GDSL hydrolase family protein [Lachnospiraceae bacterium]